MQTMVVEMAACGFRYTLLDLTMLSWSVDALAQAVHMLPLADVMHPVGEH